MSDTTIFPTIATPIAPVAPDVPYTNHLVWLSFAPRIDGSTIDASLSIKAQPYRLLDGVVDIAPDSMIRTINVGSVLEQAAKDATLATILATLATTIATYLE